MDAETRLASIGLILPAPTPPSASYVRARQAGSLVFLAGHGPLPRADGTVLAGKVGRDLDIDEAVEAARLVGVNLLATLRAQIGSLDRVSYIVKVFGMVNSAPGFIDASRVVDGCSDLLVEVFGLEAGVHARSAIGVAELPRNFPVEIEMIVAVA